MESEPQEETTSLLSKQSSGSEPFQSHKEDPYDDDFLISPLGVDDVVTEHNDETESKSADSTTVTSPESSRVSAIRSALPCCSFLVLPTDEDLMKFVKERELDIKFMRLVQRLGLMAEKAKIAAVIQELSVLGGGWSAYHLRRYGDRIAMLLESEGKDDIDFSVNILVLGKTGVGKSATINSIIGEEKVQTNAFEPETTCVKLVTGVSDGVRLNFIDTPGLKSSASEQDFNRKTLASVKKFTKKICPDVMLYVDRLDSPTKHVDDIHIIRTITNSLGTSIWKTTILTFTHAGCALPDDPFGAPLDYDVFVRGRNHVIQLCISRAIGEVMKFRESRPNPVSLLENHTTYQMNPEAQFNVQSWRPQLLLLCYSLKIVSDARLRSILKKPRNGNERKYRIWPNNPLELFTLKFKHVGAKCYPALFFAKLSGCSTNSTPADDIDEDENYYACPNSFSLSFFIRDDNEASKPKEPYNSHLLAAPFLQVFSVRVYPHFEDSVSHTCGIYGSINVTEEDNTATFSLYERTYYDPEVIQKQGSSLTLFGPRLGESLSVISRSRGATMHLNLRDSVRDVELIDSQLNFGSMTEEVDTAFDRVQSATVKGQYCHVRVHYATVLYGVMASIEVRFINVVDYGGDPPSDVYLVVTAHYGRSKWYRTEDEMLLVNRPLNEFIEQPGSFMLLGRHAVVVPAYSSLIVKASLHSSSGKTSCGYAVFSAGHGQYSRKIKVKTGHVRVVVKWADAHIRLSQPISHWGSQIPAVKMSGTMHDILEVFSVRVCGINRNVQSVSGTITVSDWVTDPDYYIFERYDKKSELLFPCDETLSLQGPDKIYPRGVIVIKLNLKDPKQGLELSTGFLEWTNCTLRDAHGVSWCDKRLCSVIRGKDGFAVVHYTVFRNGFEATVEARVYFGAHGDVAALIHGSLSVRYRDYEYRTSYENKYFKMRLFRREERDRLWVANGAKIPLTRCVVGVPASSSVIIEVDLKVKSGSKEIELRGEVEFQTNLDRVKSQRILGSKEFSYIELSVRYR